MYMYARFNIAKIYNILHVILKVLSILADNTQFTVFNTVLFIYNPLNLAI